VDGREPDGGPTERDGRRLTRRELRDAAAERARLADQVRDVDGARPRRVSVFKGPPVASTYLQTIAGPGRPLPPLGGPGGAAKGGAGNGAARNGAAGNGAAVVEFGRTDAPPQPDPPVPPSPPELPTLTDLLATRPPAPAEPAEHGWRGSVRRLSRGAVALPPGVAEREDRAAVTAVQRTLDGPRTIVVINPKGGAHKTTATLHIAATFGRHRGGYTLAWDNNETRGTLGWRAARSRHRNTAVDLLADLDRFSDPDSSRVGDLDNYVRSQGSAQFDVLASDEDAASVVSIDAAAFRALHATLARFYRLLVIDTGNNMRASNWQAAIEAADQLVVVATMREDTAQSAAWALDALRATGHDDAVRRAVTVLSLPGPHRDAELAARLHDHFGRLTRAVFEVPYDPSLVAGAPIDHDALSARTRRAWLHVTAAVADGL
jgi:MinD-like ATPase involved in chromosome partitioning or flagellar assembly